MNVALADPASTHATRAPQFWLAAMPPLDVYIGVVSFTLVVIALAQWMASRYADRRAMRLFALRNGLAAIGWLTASPHRMGMAGDGAPFPPMVVATLMLALTVWALDEFLGSSTPRRRKAIAAGAGLVILVLWAGTRLVPDDARGIFIFMAASMALCAGMAWRAADRERGVGHRVVALAFLSYPVLMIGVWASGASIQNAGLAYLIAMPNLLVGVSVLIVSLIRAGRRAQAALDGHARAEQALRELNATLEQRVRDRTSELQLMVEGLQSFTRSVSHDLRGPLAGLSGVARMAEEALLQGDMATAQRMLAVIAPQSERLQSLVEGLLTLSRVGEASLTPEEQALTPLVHEALAQLALSPDMAADLTRVQVDVEELPAARVDAPMLRQVFVNLLGNAVRFTAATPDGVRRVQVGSRRHGELTEVFVSDSGPGFPPEAAHRLFQPFALLHGNGLSRNGIGLSIVRRVIERHGGTVWAESHPGRGATFWFSLVPTA